MNTQPKSAPQGKNRDRGRGKDSTRRVAANMLAAITRGKTLDDARDRLADLPPAERNLADAIAQAALRHYGEIDALTRQHMKRPLPLRPHIAHALLFIGAAQLLYMNVPAHAAINETVAATGRREQPFRGLINAVLRQIERGEKPPANAGANLPDWMHARFEAAYGDTVLAAIAAQHARTPPLDICFKTSEKAAAFAKKYAGDLLTPTHVRIRPSGDVRALDGFAAGDWFVQDIAASFPAIMLHEALGKRPHNILDLCAAPGGKTMQLANMGHRVTALDVSAHRLQRLRDNLARTQMPTDRGDIIEADMRDWQPETPFAAVLLDAPCSATGTMRRHPDLALTQRAGFAAKQAALQADMLARAADWVAPEGLLCYAVCSLDPMEGEAQAADFLSRHKNFTAHDSALDSALATSNAEMRGFIQNGFLRTTPADNMAQDSTGGGMDGFFAAIFKKTGE